MCESAVWRAAHIAALWRCGAQDCAIAIYALDDCKSAWLIKAQALHSLERHDEALADMQARGRTPNARATRREVSRTPPRAPRNSQRPRHAQR
eukprot:7342641-Prymnesium_polylepis.1